MGLESFPNELYQLLSLEISIGEDVNYRGADPSLIAICKLGNEAIKDFLKSNLSWFDLLDILESLGLDPEKYQADIKANFEERGIVWV